MPCRDLSFHDSPSGIHLAGHQLGPPSWCFPGGLLYLRILALTLTSPRPPSLCFVYTLTMLDLGRNPPRIVKSFLVLASVACISSSGKDIMPVGYLITGRASVLITCILFFPFSWLFKTCLTLCRYLAVGDHAAFSWLQCGILMYL